MAWLTIISLVFQVAGLLLKLPDIWKTILVIIDLIKVLRDAGKDTKEEEQELGRIVVGYMQQRREKNPNRKKPLQAINDQFRADLYSLKSKLLVKAS